MFSGTSSNISIMADGILIADAFCGKVTMRDGWKCAMVSLREGRVYKVYKDYKDSKVNY